MSARARGFELKGWHVLSMTLGFFALVIGVNVTFAVLAMRTFPGEVSKTAYEDGLAYDKTLAKRAEQARLGWTAEVEADQGAGRILVRFADARGAPLQSLSVVGELRRPATEAGARRIELRPLGRGLYGGEAPGAGGGWDLELTARDAQGHRFQAERRIVWP
jgi:nitrogen fixation protein FixH